MNFGPWTLGDLLRRSGCEFCGRRSVHGACEESCRHLRSIRSTLSLARALVLNSEVVALMDANWNWSSFHSRKDFCFCPVSVLNITSWTDKRKIVAGPQPLRVYQYTRVRRSGTNHRMSSNLVVCNAWVVTFVQDAVQQIQTRHQIQHILCQIWNNFAFRHYRYYSVVHRNAHFIGLSHIDFKSSLDS